MNKNSRQAFIESMHQKTYKEEQDIQTLWQGVLENLHENLKQQSSGAVRSILSDIEREIETLQRPFRSLRFRTWRMVLASAFLVMLCQVVIEGGIPQWLGQEIQSWLPVSDQEPLMHLAHRGAMELSQDGTLFLILPEGHREPKIFLQAGTGTYAGQWIINLGG